MDMNEIKKVISEVTELAIKPNMIENNMNLKEELLLDSLSMMELLVKLEEEGGFEINFRDLDLIDVETVSDIYKLIKEYQDE